MDSEKFLQARKKLGKTQKQLAELLGTSLKAVHSYEQGWRSVPAHVERQLFFLVSRKRGDQNEGKACWVIKRCPPDRKKQCPAWEFRAGRLCWFINGTICGGIVHKNWNEKMKICRNCEVLSYLLQPQDSHHEP
ncbi:MAG TPA: helix-turn-helix transcriptional regulator [Desulfatiglandales bacterium]|nr:helix-turn-helix transcriptional regulator [Desulfatiglandales bacterium]